VKPRQTRYRAAAIWLALTLWPGAAPAQDCRQALVLGLDVSLSVDPGEFRLQREGLARALTDPGVIRAMTGAPGHVQLAIYEWSGQSDQRLLLDWRRIGGAADLEAVARMLRASPQQARSGRTAIGEAMDFARDLLARRADCAIRTLDLSGDGVSNSGRPPQDMRPRLDADGIIVNALVIGEPAEAVFFGEADAAALTRYYLDHVIVGPGAFVETVFGFDGYAEAIRRKLIREVSPAHVDTRPARRLRLAAE
jgi:hypothetical protein